MGKRASRAFDHLIEEGEIYEKKIYSIGHVAFVGDNSFGWMHVV